MKVATGSYFNYYGTLDIMDATKARKPQVDIFILFIESFVPTIDTNDSLELMLDKEIKKFLDFVHPIVNHDITNELKTITEEVLDKLEYEWCKIIVEVK